MYHSLLVIFAVIGPIHLIRSRLVEVVVVVWGHDAQGFFLLSVGTLYHLEDISAGRAQLKHQPQSSEQQNVAEFSPNSGAVHVKSFSLSDV